MGSDLKGAWSNFLPNLGEPPRGTGGLLVGTQMLVAAIWGNLFDHKDAGADKHHLGVPPTPRLPSALSPPADWHQLCSCIPGLACQHNESSWPCHHRRPMQPTEEAPYTVWLATTWESTAIGEHQLHGGTCPSSEHITNPPHTQTQTQRIRHNEKTELCSKLRRQDKTPRRTKQSGDKQFYPINNSR